MPTNDAFRNLVVWQRSMTLVEEIYNITASFPRSEQFGLTAQIRRASVSIPSNIGEGKRRKKQQVFLNHLDIALGSQGEVEVQLEIAKRVGFIASSDYERLQETVEEVGRMLNGLIASMQLIRVRVIGCQQRTTGFEPQATGDQLPAGAVVVR